MTPIASSAFGTATALVAKVPCHNPGTFAVLDACMPRIVKASLVLLALLALYSLLGFLAGPRLALHYLNQTLAERLTQPAACRP